MIIINQQVLKNSNSSIQVSNQTNGTTDIAVQTTKVNKNTTIKETMSTIKTQCITGQGLWTIRMVLIIIICKKAIG